MNPLGPWDLSAPTVQSTKDQYLAYSLDKGEAAVTVTEKKGEPTEWVFIIVNRTMPRPYRNEDKGEPILYRGDQGYEFLLTAKNGPHAGWFLGKAPADGGAVPLILVKDREQAVILRYVDTVHAARPVREKSSG